ncbi:hypothetical protein FRC19_003127 [Serendipita sp. 401]|nr:hypothetical protein FRC19_003127 [Serendipita sp. 401]KAG9026097.1 hypothetical protein FS842_005138 [Serendipita sp. 407]
MLGNFAERSNAAIARSAVGRWFKLDGSGVKGERKGSKFWTEIRAGITTFSAMVYIIRQASSLFIPSSSIFWSREHLYTLNQHSIPPLLRSAILSLHLQMSFPSFLYRL